MKKDISHLEKFRHTKEGTPMCTKEGDRFGVFYIRNAATTYIIIFDSGEDYDGGKGSGWEHASVRANDYSGDRLCTWTEMCRIKSMFWEEEEAVMQIHPPKSEYVNAHQFVLHLWKESGKDFPRPPSLLVGPKTSNPLILP